MHYAEFAEDEVEASPGADTLHVANPMRGTLQSVALREAIKEYDANKWKVIGQKVGKPAKVSYTIYHLYIWVWFRSSTDHVLNRRYGTGMRTIRKRAFQKSLKYGKLLEKQRLISASCALILFSRADYCLLSVLLAIPRVPGLIAVARLEQVENFRRHLALDFLFYILGYLFSSHLYLFLSNVLHGSGLYVLPCGHPS